MNAESIIILAPCYNEELNIVAFLSAIDNVCSSLNTLVEMVIVNDGSTDKTTKLLTHFSFTSKNVSLTVLNLNFNIGHQQAILQGLIYAETTNSNKFIILDSDGQDDVSLIPKMIQMITINHFDVVHMVRKKRKESLLFKFGYTFYKIVFRLITGESIHFGNFCIINRTIVHRATTSGFIHFPAFMSKFASRRGFLNADRHKREHGTSKMKVTDLLNHAIKSFIEYSEHLLMVCLRIFIFLAIGLFVFAGYILYQKIFTNNAILGWASTISLGLFNGALITLSAFVIGTQLLKNAYGTNISFNASVTTQNRKRVKHSNNE